MQRLSYFSLGVHLDQSMRHMAPLGEDGNDGSHAAAEPETYTEYDAVSCSTRTAEGAEGAEPVSVPARHPGAARIVFAGTGEMARLYREFDWARTPLGPVEGWPQSLMTIASTVLATAFPMIVLWGPDLVQIYNDAYIPILGTKHPWGLALPTRECWPEAWSFNQPIYRRVFNGETVSFEDQLYQLLRQGPDHAPDDVYITLSYSPVPDETGSVAGALVTLLETTDRVTARRLQAERDRLLGTLSVERARLLNDVFCHTPSFLAVLRGSENVFELVNDAYYQIVGHRDLIGKPLFEALPETRGQGFDTYLGRVRETGEPLVFRDLPVLLERTPRAEIEERFIDITYLPLDATRGPETAVIAHGMDVTDRVRARHDIEKLLDETERARAEVEAANAQLANQALELELSNQQLQDQAIELESQTEELHATAIQLEERTEEAERTTERTTRLQALTAGLAAARTIDDVATVIVAEARAATGASTAMLIVRLPTTDEAMIVRQTGLPPSLLDEYQRFVISTKPGPAAECLRTGKPIFVESRDGPTGLMARCADIAEALDSLGAHALATIPLAVAGDVLGAMSFTFVAPRTFSPEDREFFLAFGHQGGQAIERARLIEAERTAIAALRQRDARLNFAMDIAELGTWELDPETQHAWRSPRHDQIFGYESLLPEWTYDMFLEHVVPEDRAHVDAAFGSALRDHTAWNFTCRIHRADGAERWIMGRGEIADDCDGHPARLLGVVRDITAERNAESALRIAKEDAETANMAKSDFLASMSHELRTPLNAIGGYTELLSLGIRGPVTEQQLEDLARIQRSQQHLLGLINDVLNVVRLDAGQIRYDIEDVPLSPAMTRVEELILPQLKTKGLAYRHVACDPTVLVRADEEKLRQVLVNLLTNATKFTDSGQVEFWCDVQPDVVHVNVRDTGIGIPADHLQKIFEPFVQVARKLNRPAEGVGLGLAISRDLAVGMGGDLTVRSAVDSGSTFTLTLHRSVRA